MLHQSLVLFRSTRARTRRRRNADTPRWMPQGIPAWGCVLLMFFLECLPRPALAQEPPQPNLALGKPVISSGATWGGLIAASLTDGDPNSFSHPLASSGTTGYYFQVDLGRPYQLDRILLQRDRRGECDAGAA